MLGHCPLGPPERFLVDAGKDAYMESDRSRFTSFPDTVDKEFLFGSTISNLR